MEFTITVERAEEHVAKLNKLAVTLDKSVTQNLYDELEALAAWIEGEVKQRTPTSSGYGSGGTLRDSIQSEVNIRGVSIEALISTPLNYGAPVEFGSKPHFPWPLEPLKSWVQRKLGKSGKEADKIAHAIGFAMKAGKSKIQRKGGAKMFQKAWDENSGKIQRKLADIGIHISEELLKQL
jgi:hypothetical protein